MGFLSISFFQKEKGGMHGVGTICVSCVKEKNRMYYAENSIKICIQKRDYYIKNIDYIKKRQLALRSTPTQREKAKKLSAKWRKSNPCMQKHAMVYRKKNIDAIASMNKVWAYNNKSKVCASTARYRASLYNASVSWADTSLISEVYDTILPGEHVDHVVPLQGLTVCGLHNEFNLEAKLSADNISKSNRWDVSIDPQAWCLEY